MPRRLPREEAAAATSARGSGARALSAQTPDRKGCENLRNDRDVLSLQALGAAGGLEFDLLVLLERAVAARCDRAEVREDVGRAVVRSDEAEALVGVEPLDGSGSHILFLL